jgi:hypothetical protein
VRLTVRGAAVERISAERRGLHSAGRKQAETADAATLGAEPELSGPARDAIRAVAAHLTGLVQHAQADGGIRPDADPRAAAWLLLSVLSARRLRAAAMPAGLEPAVTALALDALASPAPGRQRR